ncbi:MAG: VTT domain-containing protein, partial [Nevskiales bacterium]|nr:VTT domain-containing protein [Nevskiales bacterium]
MLTLLGVWQFSPLQAYSEPRVIAEWLRELGRRPLAPLWIISLYLVANALLAPNTVLNAAAILALGTPLGPIYALSGSLAAAAAAYAVGRRMGAAQPAYLRSPRMERLARSVRNGGVVGVATVRMVPIAPYSVVNAALGASGVRFGAYLLGTAIGLLPGVIAIAAFGRGIDALLRDPDADAARWLVLLGVAALAGMIVLQRWIRRRLPSAAETEDGR